MAKIDINFNNNKYTIDESSLSAASSALKQHLSSVMNGQGATINFDGVTYSVDSTKLNNATNAFVSHLGTISGSGHKVKVNGVEYSVGSDKVAGAVSEIEDVLGGLNNPSSDETLEGDGQEFHKFAPTALTFRSTAPLNELKEVQINGVTVDPSNYTLEEGSTIVTLPIEYLKTLDVDNYEISVVSDNKTAKGGFTVFEPELNEHGFYYNQPYTAYVESLGGKIVFFNREGGTLDIINIAANYNETCTYTIDGKNATMNTSMGVFTGTYSDDGKSVYCNELQVIASLGDASVISDSDYIYTYKEDLGGYEVRCINATKEKYGKIKTGINGIDTVKILDFCFADNRNLADVFEIPDGIIIVGANAFAGCISLEGVYIPVSVTSIGNGALYDCTSLQNITFEGTVEQWNSIVFESIHWYTNVPATYVQCSDGQVPLN